MAQAEREGVRMKLNIEEINKVKLIHNGEEAHLDRFCPHRAAGESQCGSWCPFFKIQVVRDSPEKVYFDVQLGCVSAPRFVQVTPEEDQGE